MEKLSEEMYREARFFRDNEKLIVQWAGKVAQLEAIREAACHGHKPLQAVAILREWARSIEEKQCYESTLTIFLKNIAGALEAGEK